MTHNRKEMIAHLKNLKIRGEGAWISQPTADNIIELLEADCDHVLYMPGMLPPNITIRALESIRCRKCGKTFRWGYK